MHGEIKEIYDNFVKRLEAGHKRDKAAAKRREVIPKKLKPGKISIFTIPTAREFNEELESHKKRSETFSKTVSKRMKGRKLSDSHKFKISRSLNSRWVVIDPTGKEHLVDNLKSFCAKYGLSYQCMSAVNKGRLKTHQGWLCKKLDNYDKNMKKLLKYGFD